MNTLEQFANTPVFPTQPKSVARPGVGDTQEITNTVEGGLCLVEYVAIEFTKAILANPAYLVAVKNPITGKPELNTQQLMVAGIQNAKIFVAMLYEAKTSTANSADQPC